MVKYDKDGELITGLLDDNGVISKERIKKEDYKQYKKDFDEIVELLSLNKLYHSMYSELLDYEITDDLEFKTLSAETYETYTLLDGLDFVVKEDNCVQTMNVVTYQHFHQLCSELLIKVKRSWDKLNEVERFIIKSLEFDTPPDTDENVSYKLGYDSKKYYQYKESGFIKLGMQLQVGNAKKLEYDSGNNQTNKK